MFAIPFRYRFLLVKEMERSEKSLITIVISIVLMLSMCLTAYAVPKTMPDGTMFDAEYYAQNNPDVVALVGDSEDALWVHYDNFGRNEGRKPTEDGIVVPSVTQTATVTAPSAGSFGDMSVIKKSKKEVLWFFRGHKPGGNPYDVSDSSSAEGVGFDHVRYAADYPDVAAQVGTSHEALWNHYKTKGYDEGRDAHYNLTGDPRLYGDCFSYAETVCVAKKICNNNMSDYEKARAVFDYISSHCEYDWENYNNGTTDNYLDQSAYGFYKYGKMVCGGYAYTYSIFMNVLGIQNIRDYCISEDRHASNIIYIDGRTIRVDVTRNKFDY